MTVNIAEGASGFSVFYSWQSDAPDKANKRFIREALDLAVAMLGEQVHVVDAPRVASGMDDVAGMPEVATAMFDQIDRCDVFLGDITLLGKIRSMKSGKRGKLTPNPNVITELGYAGAKIGWERIVCVINEHYGKRDKLPFDIVSKRHPIDYVLDPKTMEGEAKEKKNLAKYIRKALAVCMKARHRGIDDAISRLDILCLTICGAYRNAPYFRDLAQDDANRKVLADVIDVPGFRSGIRRLLDLRLLYTESHSKLYAYHWSHRGKLLLGELTRLNQLSPLHLAVNPPLDEAENTNVGVGEHHPAIENDC